MAHKDEGQYRQKHSPGAAISDALAAAVRQKTHNGEMACADAFAIAAEQRVPPGEAGMALDLLEVRISKCQLGLFGYGPGVKILRQVEAVAPELEKALRSRLADGRLSCAAAWEIGAQLGLAKLDVPSACEALGMKIKPCQLGA